MRSSLLAKLRAAVKEWAQLHNVETTLIEAKYTGLGSNVHVLVVASKGFENWSRYERHNSLFQFLHDKVGTNEGLVITRLSMMTEEEYETYYEEVEI
jgi:stress-induced morphogen